MHDRAADTHSAFRGPAGVHARSAVELLLDTAVRHENRRGTGELAYRRGLYVRAPLHPRQGEDGGAGDDSLYRHAGDGTGTDPAESTGLDEKSVGTPAEPAGKARLSSLRRVPWETCIPMARGKADERLFDESRCLGSLLPRRCPWWACLVANCSRPSRKNTSGKVLQRK